MTNREKTSALCTRFGGFVGIALFVVYGLKPAFVYGGLIGVVVLIAVIPIMKKIVLVFGPPEFFMLSAMGLAAIALSTGRQFLRGLIAGGRDRFEGRDLYRGDPQGQRGVRDAARDGRRIAVRAHRDERQHREAADRDQHGGMAPPFRERSGVLDFSLHAMCSRSAHPLARRAR